MATRERGGSGAGLADMLVERVQRRATATAAKSTDPATGRVDRASLNQATPLLGPLCRDLEQEG
jgi:hypothetical protein